MSDSIRTPSHSNLPPWARNPVAARRTHKPDVVIHRVENGYKVEVPSRITMIEQVGNSEPTGKFNGSPQTLLELTEHVVNCQREFLDTGLIARLKPLTRVGVADQMGVHESTISRTANGKYVKLPNNEVISYALFFKPALAIRAIIAEIVSREEPDNPLSDRVIMEMLHRQGFEIARRTVMKYRDAQKLLASNRRRR